MESNQEKHQSVLLWLQPRNQSARKTLYLNSSTQKRVVSVEIGEMKRDMLQINIDEVSRAPSGLVTFGRHTDCDIVLDDSRVSGQHCHIDINVSSGELVLHHTGSQPTTWLNHQLVATPPQRALVQNHAQYLMIGRSEFQVHFPAIEITCRQDYRDSVIRKAKEILEARQLNMVGLNFALTTMPPTRLPTRPATQGPTPGRMPPSLEPKPLEIKNIGSGAFGYAWLAAHPHSADYLVVKKILKFELSESQSASRPWNEYQEIEILRQLVHPNIVEMLGWRETTGEICLELEYCELGDMSKLMPMLATEYKELDQFWQQIAAGLDYLHGKNILHRDLKPANILARQDGNRYIWKLADFGLSKEIDPGHTHCGSAMWAAPEVFLKLNMAHTAALDIFAFGIILAQILAMRLNLSPKIFNRSPRQTEHRRDLIEIRKAIEPAVHSRHVSAMLLFAPARRPSASDCLVYVEKWIAEAPPIPEMGTHPTRSQSPSSTSQDRRNSQLTTFHKPQSSFFQLGNAPTPRLTWSRTLPPSRQSQSQAKASEGHRILRPRLEGSKVEKPPKPQRATKVVAIRKLAETNAKKSQLPR